MAGRLDPPHDRVLLRLDELRAISRLEACLIDMDRREAAEAAARRRSDRWRARRWALGHMLWRSPRRALPADDPGETR